MPKSQRDLDAIANMAIEAMKSQLLIVMVNRLGGKISIPVSEIDATGPFLLAMQLNVEQREFVFTVVRKDEGAAR